ncbi:hypothetical protein UY3_03107 [Chelonia mydas]|uniref:Uncharacterized protein n=1 Tax=Chelonia mydas TaxID=8469 RepID=M7C5B2_CHEMY|nr:hypothetical protein UY3_03107 [Chelonia mydas]
MEVNGKTLIDFNKVKASPMISTRKFAKDAIVVAGQPLVAACSPLQKQTR